MTHEGDAAPIRYVVVLGCGHRRRTHDLSNYPPTTAAVALCDECGRHVPVVVEAFTRNGADRVNEPVNAALTTYPTTEGTP